MEVNGDVVKRQKKEAKPQKECGGRGKQMLFSGALEMKPEKWMRWYEATAKKAELPAKSNVKMNFERSEKGRDSGRTTKAEHEDRVERPKRQTSNS
jgi:hypothetical protein